MRERQRYFLNLEFQHSSTGAEYSCLKIREERIDAMLESAQTQSYNTAMELGQRGIRLVTLVPHKCHIKPRYVTGVVMEGALRAPGLMADIVQVVVWNGRIWLIKEIIRLGSWAWSQEAELAHFKTSFLSSVIRTRLSNLHQRYLNYLKRSF